MHNKRSEKAMVILDQMQNSFVNAKELIRDFFRPISVLRLSDNIDEQRARGESNRSAYVVTFESFTM
jgi:hypothetical protein